MKTKFRALAWVVGLGALIGPSTFGPALGATTARQAMIVIDLSGSMQGKRLPAAKEALRQLASRLDPQLAVGLVTFNSTATLAQAPTTDRSAFVGQVERVQAGGKTALFDGLKIALSNLENSSAILLIADGEDNASTTSFNEVLALAQAKGIPLNSIAIDPTSNQFDMLAELAARTGGLAVPSTNLQMLIDALPKAFVAVLSQPTSAPEVMRYDKYPLTSKRIAVGLAILALVLLSSASWQLLLRRRRQALLDLVRPPIYSRDSVDETVFTQPFSKIIARLRNYLNRLQAILNDSGISEPVRDWVTKQFVMLIVVFALTLFLTKDFAVTVFFSPLLAIWLSSYQIKRNRQGIVDQFQEEFHSSLLVMASSLRAGLSFSQAMENLSREGDGEVSRQFRRALQEVQIGSTLEDALGRVASRVRSEDLRWVIAAVAIQREVGGSLASILISTAEMVQNRFSLQREVRGLSAEGRMSAQVLIALPLIIFGYFFITRREYISVFWNSTFGFAMLVLIGLLELLGWSWIKRLVEVKV